MKKTVLSFLLLFPVFLNAQISIGSSAMPVSGDTLRYTIAILDTAVLLNYQNSGANQSWQFNQLVPQRQAVSEFKASSQTPYTAIQNRIGEKLSDTISLGGIELYDVYNFYNSSSTEFAMDYRGAGFPTGIPFFPVYPIQNSFADKDEVYQFPLNYGDNDTSTFQFVFQSPTIPGVPQAYYESAGTRINQVDAWGSITTPYGTFQSIRVITDIIGYDSVSFNGTTFGLPSHRREYKWLSNQEKIPVLTVQGTVITGAFVPAVVQYRDSVRDVPALLSPIALFNSDTTVYEINETVTFNNLSVSLIGGNYLWDIQPNSFQYVNNTSATTDSIIVQFTDTGKYSVQLIAINSEGRDTLLREDYITIVEPNSIQELKNERLQISPNPIQPNSEVTITSRSNVRIESIQIIDPKGSIIQEIDMDRGKKSFHFPNAKAGFYFIRLNTNKGSLTKKVIVS